MILEDLTDKALATPILGHILYSSRLQGMIFRNNIDGLVLDCNISNANALEILYSYTKPWPSERQFHL